jgi:hypothetical protein
MDELLSTEQSYVTGLTTAIKDYMDKMREIKEIKEETIKEIFNNLPVPFHSTPFRFFMLTLSANMVSHNR